MKFKVMLYESDNGFAIFCRGLMAVFLREIPKKKHWRTSGTQSDCTWKPLGSRLKRTLRKTPSMNPSQLLSTR